MSGLLTVKEFAGLVRLDPFTIYRRIWANRQPGVIRIGRNIRIDGAIALRRVETASIPPYGAAPALGGLYKHV